MEKAPALLVSRLPVGRPRHCGRQPVEVGGIDDPQPAPLRLLVDRNLAHAMADALLAGSDSHRNALADQPQWHRVAVRCRSRRGIVADDAGQFAQRSKRLLPAKRLQPMCLLTREADDRRLARRAVNTHVRHLTLPLGEMRLECLPAREGMPRNRVLLHVADAILRLALRARPIPRAGARTEWPLRLPHVPVAPQALMRDLTEAGLNEAAGCGAMGKVAWGVLARLLRR